VGIRKWTNPLASEVGGLSRKSQARPVTYLAMHELEVVEPDSAAESRAYICTVRKRWPAYVVKQSPKSVLRPIQFALPEVEA
jgi:hypothetical protein